MEITLQMVKDIRNQTGAGLLACRDALQESESFDAAVEWLKEHGHIQAIRRSDHATNEGFIGTYNHHGLIGTMVEVRCETDFVSHTEDFQQLALNLAMHLAATDTVPESSSAFLKQLYFRDQSKTVADVVEDLQTRVKENICIGRFSRLHLRS